MSWFSCHWFPLWLLVSFGTKDSSCEIKGLRVSKVGLVLRLAGVHHCAPLQLDVYSGTRAGWMLRPLRTTFKGAARRGGLLRRGVPGVMSLLPAKRLFIGLSNRLISDRGVRADIRRREVMI
jgi:hypothetical protein